MYVCHSCETLIEEPKTIREQVGEYWGEPYYEEYASCPYCGEELEEADKCDICGEYIVSGTICERCQDLIEDLERHIDELVREYDLDKDELVQHLINHIER